MLESGISNIEETEVGKFTEFLKKHGILEVRITPDEEYVKALTSLQDRNVNQRFLMDQYSGTKRDYRLHPLRAVKVVFAFLMSAGKVV